MIKIGLEKILQQFPKELRGKKIGVLCHAASVTSRYSHILEELMIQKECIIGAVFGPQHGLFGQTQDNMVEWEGTTSSGYNAPLYSLYGKSRKPTPEMLEGLEALVIDLQDVGTRVYTYIWTIKLCMEACSEAGLPIWILDRPNPISAVQVDGPMLSPDLFTFVGGAEIPLCHRLTIGEMGNLMKLAYFPKLDLNIVWMEGWWRNSLFSEHGLPWVLPSPNMPTIDTAIVYPGMVLLEATTLSEGRGTTMPFELFGAPYVNVKELKEKLFSLNIPGCVFREHAFIPSFQKWQKEYCFGMQIHVTNPREYLPVLAAVAILSEISQTSDPGFNLIDPPYEYEHEKRPFDMVAGNRYLGDQLKRLVNLGEISDQWQEERKSFLVQYNEISRYPEEL